MAAPSAAVRIRSVTRASCTSRAGTYAIADRPSRSPASTSASFMAATSPRTWAIRFSEASSTNASASPTSAKLAAPRRDAGPGVADIRLRSAGSSSRPLRIRMDERRPGVRALQHPLDTRRLVRRDEVRHRKAQQSPEPKGSRACAGDRDPRGESAEHRWRDRPLVDAHRVEAFGPPRHPPVECCELGERVDRTASREAGRSDLRAAATSISVPGRRLPVDPGRPTARGRVGARASETMSLTSLFGFTHGLGATPSSSMARTTSVRSGSEASRGLTAWRRPRSSSISAVPDADPTRAQDRHRESRVQSWQSLVHRRASDDDDVRPVLIDPRVGRRRSRGSSSAPLCPRRGERGPVRDRCPLPMRGDGAVPPSSVP